MDTAMTYNKLYSNMVRKFTVEKNNKDYKLGDYMMMKATAKKNNEATTNLPAVSIRQSVTMSLASLATFINDKLTVKEAPVRDRTIRKFPLRTSISALCSAMVMCALVISCAVFGIQANTSPENIVETRETEIQDENDTTQELSEEIVFTE